MSSDDPSHVPVERDRREAVREKAQLVQAQQSRARTIRRGVLAVAGVAVVAVGAVVVSWAVGSAASRPTASPANVAEGGFRVTDVSGVAASAGTLDDATPAPTESAEPTPDPTPTDRTAVDIQVYVDYLSTGSREFQLANAQQLAAWVEQDAATLTYYPVAMLTSKSNGTKYSLRAAGAAACIGSYSPTRFFAFTHALFEQQPAVDSDGLGNDELADLAIASGADAPKTVRDCIEDEKYTSWAKTATERALKGLPGIPDVALTGTPMVLVNGKTYVGALDDPAEFAQFVMTIDSDTYYKSTPTPTPAATS